MSKAGAKHSEVKELLMKDEVFKEEYEKLKLREELLGVEQDRLDGHEDCNPEELDKYLDGIIEDVGREKDSAT
ncbi:MAG: toxin-antitoxin system, antitoxin component, PHD family protein [Firmicutes bacterium]|nr:toxin-antitoxin system, antitoxin component, PHD family protein [Bacillota bacterium]